jgi:transposase
MSIFQVSRNTIYNWFNNWEIFQLVGLYDRHGRGRKKLFNEAEEKQIKKWVEENPKNLKKVKIKIEKDLGKKTSKKTITRIIKGNKMNWVRIRKTVGGEPLLSFYEKKILELEQLKQREANGEIEIRYVDESGFCLIPYVPYAWPSKDNKISLKSRQSKRLNIVGFMSKKNELEAYTFEDSINSDVIISCIDKFCETVTKKTYLVLDNSSIHQNNLFWNKENEWKEKEVEIFFLPSYSPHLNLIEILWRFIKYEWLESTAYESFSTLVHAVEKIIINFGTEYTINFV